MDKTAPVSTAGALIAVHANSLKLPVACVDGDFNRFAIKKLFWAASAGTRTIRKALVRADRRLECPVNPLL